MQKIEEASPELVGAVRDFLFEMAKVSSFLRAAIRYYYGMDQKTGQPITDTWKLHTTIARLREVAQENRTISLARKSDLIDLLESVDQLRQFRETVVQWRVGGESLADPFVQDLPATAVAADASLQAVKEMTVIAKSLLPRVLSHEASDEKLLRINPDERAMMGIAPWLGSATAQRMI